ncbi:MAG: carbon-nitrogen hydrolase family protein [Paludibacteraceae bacterium]
MLGRKIKVASVQAAPVFMDKKRTIEKFCSLIEEAGKEGAELIVFPETAIPTYPYWRGSFGYTSPETAKDWRDTVVDLYDNSVRIPSDDTSQLCKAAAKANAYCVIGLNEVDDRPGSATLYNSMLFLDRRGSILGKHRKIMPTHQERIFWGRGDASDLVVFDTDIGRIGGLICYENHMTLAKAALAIKGEEIHAASWPGWWNYVGEGKSVKDMSGSVGPLHMCDIDSAVREYAFETQTFVISSSMYMPEHLVPDSFPYKKQTNWKWAVGGSSIVNPFGMYLVEPVFHQETILYAEIDMSDRIVAKNIFDAMGHYTRWDMISLRIRENDVEPMETLTSRDSFERGSISYSKLEEISKKFKVSTDKLDLIIQELLKKEISIK